MTEDKTSKTLKCLVKLDQNEKKKKRAGGWSGKYLPKWFKTMELQMSLTVFNLLYYERQKRQLIKINQN